MEETGMALPLPEEPMEPDISHLITEDDTPVDSVYSEKQMRLLTSSLYASWKPGREFLALANVGLFAIPENPAIVPDVMLSLDVTLPEDIFEKGNRCYMVWRYGKPPDLVIEVVSNKVGGELEKAETYARIGIGYYVIHDPERWLGERPLRAFERHGRRYVEMLDCSWLEQLGLGLTLWKGTFEGWSDTWLRWCDREGNLLPTGEEQRERAEAAEARVGEQRERAEAAEARVGEQRERAEAAETQLREQRERAERLQARLRELGVED
jgi:Uma2 family endonuclease